MNSRLRIANAALGLRHVFIRDLVLDAEIGVYAQEHGRKQPIRINIDLAVNDTNSCQAPFEGWQQDDLDHVVDYGPIVENVCAVVAARHVKLVETLAEQLAELCLADHRVTTAWVMVEKLAVFHNAASVGVQVQRHQKLPREYTAMAAGGMQSYSQRQT